MGRKAGTGAEPMTIGEIISSVADGEASPVRIEAYDGSSFGPADCPLVVRMVSPEALQQFVLAPGDLGLARAYLTGSIEVDGVHPAAPHDIFGALEILRKKMAHKPDFATALRIAKSVGLKNVNPGVPVPEMEVMPPWRRALSGLQRHSKERDSKAVSYHYDVSNKFYEWVLGESMTYTCACYPNAEASLEEAQENKYRLVFDKLGLKAGDRLLDVGCGWGGMVRYAARRGVHAIGVTLSKEQAGWAQAEIEKQGLGEFAEVRLQDYRDVPEGQFDAISSIGITEHVGRDNYSAYFEKLRSLLKPGGLLLNHSITRPENSRTTKAGAFIDRYIFPDGELAGPSIISAEAENVGFETIHSENLRPHYAFTLRDWCKNLEAHWDEAVEEVGLPMAKLWGLYMGACQYGFETNVIQLHQFLLVNLDEDAGKPWTVPLRPWWEA
ncbi:MAG TPA: class I SAM-dependent methyltransferase [Dietzia timorensis]|uniref:Class I SAM-dependent methyltransferase n=1 Tax=Dietzia timorensis TaxID=499555 RepID=A0A921F344_9ACTN|nr:class I SAM-dependent methyltransferase [Dietzia timorensis]HJE89723.1 class I SAM-dependent methyltransferase [Dietzia timorensis]